MLKRKWKTCENKFQKRDGIDLIKSAIWFFVAMEFWHNGDSFWPLGWCQRAPGPWLWSKKATFSGRKLDMFLLGVKGGSREESKTFLRVFFWEHVAGSFYDGLKTAKCGNFDERPWKQAWNPKNMLNHSLIFLVTGVEFQIPAVGFLGSNPCTHTFQNRRKHPGPLLWLGRALQLRLIDSIQAEEKFQDKIL